MKKVDGKIVTTGKKHMHGYFDKPLKEKNSFVMEQ